MKPLHDDNDTARPLVVKPADQRAWAITTAAGIIVIDTLDNPGEAREPPSAQPS